MTNAHCIKTNADTLNTEFEFMGEESTCSATNGNCWMCERGVIYNAESLVVFNARKDYALVRLTNNPIAEYGYLELDPDVAAIGDKIYIPQHPGGRAKVCLPNYYFL
jgi:lysyl endopeptidase